MAAAKSFGVVGLGVMGQNLALNIERNGHSVAAYDIDPAKLRSSRSGRNEAGARRRAVVVGAGASAAPLHAGR